ncbi:MAG: Nudix family hydrolase [Candidatus Daviesbacteria bacterium GW2011_GWA1_41_61]|uniref:Nudix family hydrolase n=1 Tax=Candidatus Daviesbacteria bacterium GW2011_GWA2_40_9 TaxID=1618424 RepID=A0A0G0U6X5_9BACT|nr:MAG: Nudix family hydrolase [Candidatus Daviesbacteria bacterium GW2011_GWC1_40_9]KKR82961.1 MAG: Nudix family hydrolase [Candidatus Daviesbacteria bacterium GW2011_GWA2_40_9]KKR92888.1 MAG: Nudix family hydrolase [Candidatus Daviesbacteria bacterium GW2011_GWB1_41_15]KKS15432.1 MAG: Nudix family hydrolase [Candidatus Daviesbacteria bacterium GW2011_GWA1_41_61]
MKIKKELSAGGVLFKEVDGEYYVAVIHRSKQNDWTLPKGHVEPGESLEDTALREVEEETNNKAVVLKKIGSFSYSVEDKEKDITYKRTVHWFLMKSKGDNSHKLNFETDQVRWLKVDEDFSFMNYANDKSILGQGIKLINNL